MVTLNILICGGGCAGPALALFLSRNGHKVTIVERCGSLRAAGAQIDLRAQGIKVVKRMGIHDAIVDKLVDEAGVSLVDSQGKIHGTILANTSGKGAQSLTSEYEIMRGDLVQVLYDATKNDVKYVFGTTVERFEQDEKQVTAFFSNGTSGTYDMLVGADGQGSRIREAILPPGSPLPYRKTGVHMSYWMIPRDSDDDNVRRTYLAPGGRMIMRRTHGNETQVYFLLVDSDPKLSSVHRAPVEQQKEFWEGRLRDAGWQAQRFIDGMRTTENFYSQEVVQVQTETWHKGRVVLLGDAGYCPSPLSGMGTTGSFVGAYVLAGEICRHSEDFPTAFANYDQTLRPFVAEIQKLNLGLIIRVIPQQQWVITVIQFIYWVVCSLRIPGLISRWKSEDEGGWPLPEYPELKM